MNPYLPLNVYIPDGEPHVFGDRLYLFGSHDSFNSHHYCPLDYELWSAPVSDLSAWENHGIIFRKDQDPDNPDGSHDLFAPDCVEGPDGYYYLYYCLDNIPEIHLARANRPEGPYAFYGRVSFPDHVLGRHINDPYGFDPAVFVENGHVYLYTGFSANTAELARKLNPDHLDDTGLWGMELASDMKTIQRLFPVLVPGPAHARGTSFADHPFLEASSLRKIGSYYYLIYSSYYMHELCWSRSDSPEGPFTYGGVLISNADLGYHGNTFPQACWGNNHGSIVQIKDRYAVFYHRQTNRDEFSRQGCAEWLTISPDGNIPQVEMTTQGLTGPLSQTGTYVAGYACNLYTDQGAVYVHDPAVSQFPCITQLDNDSMIDGFVSGSHAVYKYFACTGNPLEIDVEIKGSGYGQLICAMDESACTININPSASWQTVSTPLTPAQGKHALSISFIGTGALQIKAFHLSEAH